MPNTVILLIVLCAYGRPQSPPALCGCIRSRQLHTVRDEANAELKAAGAVFVGRITSITDTVVAATPESRTFQWPIRMVVVRVDSLWKGPEVDSLVIWTGMGGGDCGYQFQVGSSYLIFAMASDTRRLVTGICSLTQARSTADEHIRALGAPRYQRQADSGSAP